MDVEHNSTNVFIYEDSTQLFSGTINAHDSSPLAFSLSNLPLTARHTIDVIVTTNSDCCLLNTGLRGTIAESTAMSGAPEPGTFALSLLVLPGIVYLRRRSVRLP